MVGGGEGNCRPEFCVPFENLYETLLGTITAVATPFAQDSNRSATGLQSTVTQDSVKVHKKGEHLEYD